MSFKFPFPSSFHLSVDCFSCFVAVDLVPCLVVVRLLVLMCSLLLGGSENRMFTKANRPFYKGILTVSFLDFPQNNPKDKQKTKRK